MYSFIQLKCMECSTLILFVCVCGGGCFVVVVFVCLSGIFFFNNHVYMFNSKLARSVLPLMQNKIKLALLHKNL